MPSLSEDGVLCSIQVIHKQKTHSSWILCLEEKNIKDPLKL